MRLAFCTSARKNATDTPSLSSTGCVSYCPCPGSVAPIFRRPHSSATNVADPYPRRWRHRPPCGRRQLANVAYSISNSPGVCRAGAARRRHGVQMQPPIAFGWEHQALASPQQLFGRTQGMKHAAVAGRRPIHLAGTLGAELSDADGPGRAVAMGDDFHIVMRRGGTQEHDPGTVRGPARRTVKGVTGVDPMNRLIDARSIHADKAAVDRHGR